MQQYLKKLIDSLTGPKPTFNIKAFSLARVMNKRKMLGECMKMWKYTNEDDLDRDIARTYLGLVQGIKDKDEPLVLRNLSIQLFHQYKEKPGAFYFQDKISDIVILDCVKTKRADNQAQWFQLWVKIKHFKTVYYYALERKICADSFRPQPTSVRKWYFIDLPLQKLQQQILQ